MVAFAGGIMNIYQGGMTFRTLSVVGRCCDKRHSRSEEM